MGILRIWSVVSTRSHGDTPIGEEEFCAPKKFAAYPSTEKLHKQYSQSSILAVKANASPAGETTQPPCEARGEGFTMSHEVAHAASAGGPTPGEPDHFTGEKLNPTND